MPFYEPGLEEIVESNVREGRLSFTGDLKAAVKNSKICFIAVGTPADADGAADLSGVFAVAKEIAESMDGYRIIATKSTVPVGTGAKLTEVIAGATSHAFSVVSNPEFLKQGDAVNDFLKPDRVVIGTSDSRARDEMRDLYAPFMRTGNRVIEMDVPSAEMTKYAANAFLAVKISFINEIGRLCEAVGADVDQVRTGISRDPRIGGSFLFPGVGFGGSCLPKDVRALLRTAKQARCDMPVVESAWDGNRKQFEFYWNKIVSCFGEDLTGRIFSVWGLAFKPRTDDLREAPALRLIDGLLERGGEVRAFDPKAMDNFRRLYGSSVTLCSDSYEACKGSDALLIMTEWNEFRRPSFERVRTELRAPLIIDGRNLFEPKVMAERGFQYHSVGRAVSQVPT